MRLKFARQEKIIARPRTYNIFRSMYSLYWLVYVDYELAYRRYVVRLVLRSYRVPCASVGLPRPSGVESQARC